MSSTNLPLEFQSPALPRVSVIVPVFNQELEVRSCLMAIRDQVYPGELEIIIVDNASRFGLQAMMEAEPDVTFVSEPLPGSYNARNSGIRVATGEVLAFTDADCRPQSNWLVAGVSALRSDSNIGVVGGAINVVVDHNGAPSLPELYEIATAFPQKAYVERENYATTANMFTRRSTVSRAGSFNGALKSGGDSEFCRRVNAVGLGIVYAEDAVVQHPARTTFRALFSKARRLAGGHRDRHPSWHRCVLLCWRNVFPPRRRLRSILKSQGPSVNLVAKAQMVALAMAIGWAFAYYRIVFQITDAESPRS